MSLNFNNSSNIYLPNTNIGLNNCDIFFFCHSNIRLNHSCIFFNNNCIINCLINRRFFNFSFIDFWNLWADLEVGYDAVWACAISKREQDRLKRAAKQELEETDLERVQFRLLSEFLDDETGRKAGQARQQRRNEVLSTTAADFRAFAEVLEWVNEEGRVVVMGSQKALESANAVRGDWLDIKKAL